MDTGITDIAVFRLGVLFGISFTFCDTNCYALDGERFGVRRGGDVQVGKVDFHLFSCGEFFSRLSIRLRLMLVCRVF